MSTYTPDLWSIVKVTLNGNTHYRVFASWYGGFSSGDSWKLSSGTTGCSIFKDAYLLRQESGSLYECRFFAYGMSRYSQSVFNEMSLDGINNGYDIQLLSEKKAQTYINGLLA